MTNDAADLVERARAWGRPNTTVSEKLMLEAAGEIERLRAAIAEALESLEENEDPDTVVIEILRTALNEGSEA